MKTLISTLTCLLMTFNLLSQNTTCNWAFAPVGTNTFNGKVYNTAIDQAGNIIECGTIAGVADLDPGSGPGDTAYSKPGYNYYLRKTSIGGQLQWVKFFNQTSPIPTFYVYGLEVNSQNEIIIAGDYFGTIDMDLSTTGVDTITSHQPTYPDFFLAKYDTNGDLQWAHTYGGTSGNIGVSSITLTGTDNILVSFTGGSNMDLDPGVATALAYSGSANIVCYDSNGNYIWNNQISTPTSYSVDTKSIACDAAGNSYLLSVGYYELTVTKFDNNGNELWGKTIGDFQALGRVEPHSLLVDPNGDFFIVGKYLNSVDFDPNAGSTVYSSSSANDHDGFFAAYDSSMNPYWVKTYQGIVVFGNQSLTRIGNELVAGGYITGSATMGPGTTFTATSSSPFFIKTDQQGILTAGSIFPCSGRFTTLNTTFQGHLVVTGTFSGSVDIDPTVSGTVSLTSGSFATSFTAVYASPLSVTGETLKNNFIRVYPNPTHDFIRFQNQERLSGFITVFDSNGRCCIENEFDDDMIVSIPADHLSSGIYSYRICGKSMKLISSGKIILE